MTPLEIWQQELREWQRANTARYRGESRALALVCGGMAIVAVTLCAYVIIVF